MLKILGLSDPLRIVPVKKFDDIVIIISFHRFPSDSDLYSLVGSSSGTTAPTNERPPPIATTTPSFQEPQIHMRPTPGVSRLCTQQANEPSNTASYSVQIDPAIVAPSRARSCGERQTTSNSTQDAQGQGTSTATSHSSTSAPKLKYDGAKCWHPPKPELKRISQIFRKNYNKPWLSFDEEDDDTRKIWWTEWRKCFDIIDTEEDDIYQSWRFRVAKHLRGMLHAICKKGARPYWIPPDVLGELMRRWDTDAYRQLQARNAAARKSTRGTFLHTTRDTTFPEAKLRLVCIGFLSVEFVNQILKLIICLEDHHIWMSFFSTLIVAKRIGHNGLMNTPERQSADVLDLREQITILNREVEQHAAKYRELEDRYQREKREWQPTVESLREDLNTSNLQMDQFSHQLSSLIEYVRAMGPSSSGSRVPPPPPFTFPSSQKSTAPAPVPTPAPGRKLSPILQRPEQPQSSQREDDSDDFDDSDDYLDEYE
ncbi:hypothetical protein Ahy_A07g036505 [Arachis hypogaea]|uniref:Uncharacterized protein n=1 Tax=Arachis hypogaea TaxID=3818 RepID=A0A445CGC5_ARAHY|nr:hypothetical protein Ahy_A07g036505 [Arachis hypogaea]